MLKNCLRWAAQEVGYLARYEGRKASVVTLKIRLRPFETHTRSRTLRVPTADDLVTFRAAWGLFQAGPWTGKPVRLIGLGISGWERGPLQPDLFAADEVPDPQSRDDRLHETLDEIRARFGKGTVQWGLYWRK